MDKILLVDDEENVLNGYRRSLRGKFNIETASSGPDALKKIGQNGAYPVIVSDMRMPEMTGTELLAHVKKSHPFTVRILLTGNTDQQTAVQAINEGDVFRFLNKPCTPEALAATIATAVEHHRLLTAEKDLLENTVRGAIELLVELMSLVRPDALGQTMRLKQLTRDVLPKLELGPELWLVETATLLSQLGYTTLAPNLVEKVQAGQTLIPEERKQVQSAVDLATRLVAKIPRLEEVVQIIRYQDKYFDGSGHPADQVKGEAIPLGARVLKCLLDFDRFTTQGMSKAQAVKALARHAGRYDPAVLRALESLTSGAKSMIEREVQITTLTGSMLLAEDVTTRTGVLLVCQGQEASESVQAHLMRFSASGQIGQTVKVLVPQ